MTLNDLERRNSPYLAFFTEFDSFAGQLRHSGWRYTCNVRELLSPISTLPRLAKINHTLQRGVSTIAELLTSCQSADDAAYYRNIVLCYSISRVNTEYDS